MSSRLTGFLNLYKLSGPTSHECIRQLKRIFNEASQPVPKLGHLGTLDPLAEGVLPVAFGSACRLAEYFEGEKVYRAKIMLGTTTATDDIEGEIITESDSSSIDAAGIESVLKLFVGAQNQVPPAYSAVKADGERAYKRARKGEEIILKPREVIVHRAEFLGWEPPWLSVRFSVSKGTYIRSLARDIGETLSVGGCVAELVRESDGRFLLEDGVKLPELVADGVQGIIDRLLEPDLILDRFRRANLTEEQSVWFQQGKVVEGLDIMPDQDELLKVYDDDGFLGIAKFYVPGGIKAEKVILRRI